MKNIHVGLAVLCSAPLMQSCTSIPVSLALSGVKAVMSIHHSSETPSGYYQLGRFYQAQNRLDAAAVAYSKALSLDDSYFDARSALGVVHSLQGNTAVALEHFRVAAAQSPRSAHVQNNLAYAYYLQGRYEEAIPVFESAVTLDPRNHHTLENLARAYERAGRAEKAQEAFRAVQAARTRDTAAVSNVLGTPGTTIGQQERLAAPPAAARAEIAPSPSPAAPPVEIAPAPAAPTPAIVTAAAPPPAEIPTAPIPVATTTTSPAAANYIPASSAWEVISGKTEPAATIVTLTPNVYELRLSKALTPLPLPIPARHVNAVAAIPPAFEIPKPAAVAVESPTKIVQVAPAIYELQLTVALGTVPSVPVVAAASATMPHVAPTPSITPAIEKSASVPTRLTTAMAPSGQRVRLEVSNGNGITGLAKRVSQKLKQLELHAARLTNQLPARSSTSIEYREGYRDEAAKVASGLTRQVALVQTQHLRPDINVRLVLGRDVRNDVALFQSTERVAEPTPITAEKAVVATAPILR